MHRISLSLILLITLLAAFLVAGEVFKAGWKGEVLSAKSKVMEEEDKLLEETRKREVAFSELKKYPYFEPKSLSLHLSSGKEITLALEKIDLDQAGELQAPSSWQSAGWYLSSAKPGQQGTVIIDGHYDTNTGAPAAFWVLKSANPNDTVSIKDELGRDFTYKIVDIFFVDIQDPQRSQVLQDSGKAELILITCGGVWDEKEGTYNKRLVVKAQLVS